MWDQTTARRVMIRATFMKASEVQTSQGLNPREDPQVGEGAGKAGRADMWREEGARMGKRVIPGRDQWVHFRGEWRVQRGAQFKGPDLEQVHKKTSDTAEGPPSRDMLTSWNELVQNLEEGAK